MQTEWNIEKSHAGYARAANYLMGGGQPHKRPDANKEWPGYEIMVQRGKGNHFWDLDGNEYLDYLMAVGPIVLGYAWDAVDDAVRDAARSGTIFNSAHTWEQELAKKLTEIIPSAGLVSFCLSGSAATSTALKLARAYTGKEKIVRCGYHGWHDWCLFSPPGIPKIFNEYTIAIPYNDLEALETLLKKRAREIACIILEIVVDPPKPGFLEGVRKLASEFEVVLIFDEVKTGFRFGLGGAQKHFGVTPDLSTFGKAMGNGYPVSAVVGRKEIMEKVTHAWIASTFNGNVMSVAAGLATIRELERTNAIARFWPLGEQLMKGLDRIAAEAGIVGRSVGFGPMPFFKFPKEEENIKRAFYIETLRRGVYFEPNHVWFLSASHTEADIERALDVSEAALKAAIKKTR